MKCLLFGAGLKNKGAQLMLIAMARWLHENYPDCELFMSPLEASAQEAREYNISLLKNSVLHTGSPTKSFRLSWSCPKLYYAIKRLKGEFSTDLSTTTIDDLDVIFDLSGLAYSDKWGNTPMINLAWLTEYTKKKGIRYVLMPQAYGPFREVAVQKIMSTALRNVNIIFARDEQSYASVLKLSDQAKIIRSPDLTHLLIAENNESVTESYDNYFVMVPNVRMLDKAGEKWGASYIDVMLGMANRVLELTSLKLILMVHSTTGGGDRELVGKLYTSLVSKHGNRVSLLEEEDPLSLKLYLKNSQFVIASRFHALVSALSSGTPCVGTSWQHKYELLFKEYGISEYLLTESDSDFIIQLDRLCDSDERMKLSQEIKGKSDGFYTDLKSKLNNHILPMLNL